MKKPLLLLILIILVLISGCGIKSNPIFDAIFGNYNSFDSYKTTEITELKSKHYEIVHKIPKDHPDYDPDAPKEYKREIKEITTKILFKKPYNLKFVKDDSVTFIKDKIEWKYNPQKNILCKGSTLPIFQSNYFGDLIEAFNYNYKIENLEEEEINSQLCRKIKLVPKHEKGYDGGKLYLSILWINKDNNFLVKSETYNNDGEWTRRTININTQINIDIPDREFEFPADAEILPKSEKFYNVEEAEKEFSHKIKLPSYLPERFKLDFIEIKKLCNEYEYAVLNYRKNGETRLFISEVKTDEEEKRLIHPGSHGGTKCYNKEDVDYLIYSQELSNEEIEKIGKGFGCWTEGIVGGL